MKFVTRYAIMFARYKSTLGSNFLLCVSRFGFSKSAFLNGSININYAIRHHCLSVTDNSHVYVAQFMRESIFILLVVMDARICYLGLKLAVLYST